MALKLFLLSFILVLSGCSTVDKVKEMWPRAHDPVLVGNYIDFIRLFVTIILNLFSIMMIGFVLFEAKRNFDGLNYRLNIISGQT